MAYSKQELKVIYREKKYEELTQCERILKYLLEEGKIDAQIATNKLGIYRLASRVKDLKRRGYNIVGRMETGNNRFGEKTRFKVYRLEESA